MICYVCVKTPKTVIDMIMIIETMIILNVHFKFETQVKLGVLPVNDGLIAHHFIDLSKVHFV